MRSGATASAMANMASSATDWRPSLSIRDPATAIDEVHCVLSLKFRSFLPITLSQCLSTHGKAFIGGLLYLGFAVKR
jgi:hypothetical protein